jgi:hypothetical protein
MIELIKSIFLAGYIISNLFAIYLLYISWNKPDLARIIFSIIFLGACLTNWTIAINYPEDYLNFADMTVIRWYSDFITGWFSRHILLTVGCIATIQAMIGIAILLRGWLYKLAIAGGSLFLLAIIPLVVRSAFPGSIIMTIAMLKLFNRGHNPLLTRQKCKELLDTINIRKAFF